MITRKNYDYFEFRILTTNKCPLCRFLLIAGVAPVLTSMTPSLPLTSLWDTLEHDVMNINRIRIKSNKLISQIKF